MRYKESCVARLDRENDCELEEDQNDVGIDDSQNGYVQWVSDNFDHNVASLTGKGPFHLTAIIEVAYGKKETTNERIYRLKEKVKTSTITSAQGVPIHSYKKSMRSLQNDLFLRPLSQVKAEKPLLTFCNSLWNFGWFLLSICKFHALIGPVLCLALPLVLLNYTRNRKLLI